MNPPEIPLTPSEELPEGQGDEPAEGRGEESPAEPGEELLEESAEELYEHAPCGYLSTRLDGTIVRVNRTFELFSGHSREDLLGRVRFQDLLSAGGRIYHETHYAPLLRMQGSVREIAVEIVRPEGTSLPALINSVLCSDRAGRPRLIRTTVFDAGDRRRYEQELLRSSRREHDIATQLQRSLLSGALPRSQAVELAVSYSSGVRGITVGGDWYDAFWVKDESVLALVIGDVVGRGVVAAATMGQVRSAVRALALTELGPAALLTALDSYSRRHCVGEMTTLIYAELDLRAQSFRYACAGHPPPLLQVPGEEPRFLWGGRSLPLNAYGHGDTRSEACSPLPVGASLWLYTDGLIERKLSAHDELDQLRLAVADHHALPLERGVAAVATAVDDPGQSDDSCLIAARLLAS